MISVKDVLKAGARKLLNENEREREFLLKLIGEQSSDETSASIRKIARKNVKKLHWTQTPKGREKMRQFMLARHKKN
jgi:hypothetical protein